MRTFNAKPPAGSKLRAAVPAVVSVALLVALSLGLALGFAELLDLVGGLLGSE
ncbi:MAG: hypothetical protein ACTMIR_05830 [Cellulomonadaceae bacterium]